MNLSLAYLGPTGTNSETAALAYADWLKQERQQTSTLCAYPSMALVLQSVARGKVDRAVVPIENSIEGTVTIVLDTLWQADNLQVHQELTIPIFHGLLSYASSLKEIQTVYSHPQGLAQCQKWLENFLPQVQLIPTKSTTEGIKLLKEDSTAAAVSSPRAAQLYQVPLLKADIKDSSDNCTRFWIVSCDKSENGSYLSLAFSLPQNAPGALMKALEIFARREINLSKIESRPSKRSLGEYVFFIDLEGNSQAPKIKEALAELSACTEVLKIFGNYSKLDVK
ncbi:prephenate dehydratase [Waterburya agarophytonicola K14]|uniref:Prephenate dehydratase n=1 Tax=Waterburya agarophytonicola KI4 TaxID=2874699 RepID=A0A964BN67_9CYAN|nr:prephenate dehydratase [Waterburya agarophytonicola]MCC0175701.1 prephenate dehydratase [Waterburya agarophytonicola KI4]